MTYGTPREEWPTLAECQRDEAENVPSPQVFDLSTDWDDPEEPF